MRPIYTLLVAAWALAVSCKPKEQKTTVGTAIAIPRAQAIYVTNNGSDSLSVVDRDGPRVVEVKLDLDPNAHEAPHHLALDPGSSRLYVALAFPAPVEKKKDPHAGHGKSEDPGRLARLDVGTLAVKEHVKVDENPGDVVLSHDGKRVLVTHFDMQRALAAAMAGGPPVTLFATLQVWNAEPLTLFGSRPLCVAPHGISLLKDDKTALVACYGSDEIAVVDLATPSLATTRVPVGPSPGLLGAPRYGPYSATLSPRETWALVAELEGQELRVFDVQSRKFVQERTMPVGARAFMPAFVDDETAVVPLQAPDGFARVNVAKGEVSQKVAAGAGCRAPHAAARAKDGRLYVVCEGDHTQRGSVVELDPTTLLEKRRWEVGVYPDGLVLGE